MRVISGIYKGRKIDGYTIDGTRPTQERVKESLFSMIQEKVPTSIVLDLFAGSGNLGIEALSNGAKFAYFNDSNKNACKVIQKNIDTLKISNAKVTCMDYQEALKYFSKNKITFDLIFLDPPYKMHILKEIIEEIIHLELLNPSGLIVLEFEEEQAQEYSSLFLLKSRKYGYKNIQIYQKQE